MKSPTLQIRMALTVVGLLAGAACRSSADIVINSGTLSENRLGYVSDGASHGMKVVYDSSGAKPLLASAIRTDGGTSRYSNRDLAISNTNTGRALGTTFDLKSTASAEILKPTALFAYAHGSSEYSLNFQVSSRQTFDTSVSLTAGASSRGSNNSFEYLALVTLYDMTTGKTLEDTAYRLDSWKGSYFGVPASVDLLPGHQYSLFGETYAYAEISNPLGSNLGSISGSAQVHFSLLAVPEPSTLAGASLGAIGLLCPAWRRRRRSAY